MPGGRVTTLDHFHHEKSALAFSRITVASGDGSAVPACNAIPHWLTRYRAALYIMASG